MSMITDPVSAPAYLVQGWRLIQQPGLRRYALAPLAINLLVFTAATALAVWQFNRVIAWSQAQLPQWLDWLAWLLWPVFIIAVLLIFAYTFTPAREPDRGAVQLRARGARRGAAQRHLAACPGARPGARGRRGHRQ